MKSKWSLSAIAILVLGVTIGMLPGGAPTIAQSGADYDLEWSTFGTAGDQSLSGGSYQLGFTLAQDQEPGILTGGDYQILQGYWPADSYDPTGVVVAGFWAEARGDTLMVCWETATEVSALSFNLYRSESGEPGSFSQLNDEPIPAQAPGSPVGAHYEWADTGATSGQTYFYLLEAVDVEGQATWHGPVQGSLPHTRYVVYLPLVSSEP